MTKKIHDLFQINTVVFTNRKQYVQEGKTKSSLRSIVISGVRHCSILVPLFFLLFINNLPNSNLMNTDLEST